MDYGENCGQTAAGGITMGFRGGRGPETETALQAVERLTREIGSMDGEMRALRAQYSTVATELTVIGMLLDGQEPDYGHGDISRRLRDRLAKSR